MKRSRSVALFKRAKRVIPGGVNSPVRAYASVQGAPPFIERGRGARVFDADGNEYIDYVGSWGPLILGHAHARVLKEVRAALARGTSFGAPTRSEVELAELLCAALPSIQKVRMVNSGTEATMSAIRLARGFTGKDVVVKFAGNYHGHVDSLLVAAGSSAATLAVPDSPGVTSGTSQDTLVLPYNDVVASEQAFAEHAGRIAAVILEPVVGNMGCVPASSEFLQVLRDLTEKSGAVLIFDEVMTGFRVAYGGAQSMIGVTPDLTTLGKIVGGGLPIGAYGGRADIMDHILPVGKVFQAGTLSGNPIATAAGIATLETLRDEDPYPRLETLANQLAVGLEEAASAMDIPHTVARAGSMLTLFFNPDRVTDWSVASRSATDQFAKYFWAMMDRGVYLPCSQFEALFVSVAHTEADIAATVTVAREALAELAKG